MQHGGDLNLIARYAPHAPTPWLDLSTGINPYPYPIASIEPEAWHKLPQPAQLTALYNAAAQYYGAPCPRWLSVGSGMHGLMLALAAHRLAQHGRSTVHIISPTYAEHAAVWHNLGHSIHNSATLNEAAADVVIVCNPNNPTGHVWPCDNLQTLAHRLHTRNGWLLIDESFADALPSCSFMPYLTQHSNVVVLRSVGKFFGAAGLRLSMAIADAHYTQPLRVAMGAWPVSTPACVWGANMLQDNAWIQHTQTLLAQQHAIFLHTLRAHFTIIGHTPLFCLVQHPNAQQWHQQLLQHGILTRTFDYNPHWLRVGLPHATHWPRLQAALTTIAGIICT